MFYSIIYVTTIRICFYYIVKHKRKRGYNNIFTINLKAEVIDFCFLLLHIRKNIKIAILSTFSAVILLKTG
ncbi:MAG: hypothetical protein RR054_02885 [Clostridia bacterium]